MKKKILLMEKALIVHHLTNADILINAEDTKIIKNYSEIKHQCWGGEQCLSSLRIYQVGVWSRVVLHRWPSSLGLRGGSAWPHCDLNWDAPKGG